MYSYYLDYLKSFKKFISSTFPNIQHYQFSYADKAYLNYKLYEDHVKKYPMCMVNLTDITTDDNRDFFRYIAVQHNADTTMAVASNHTKQDSVIIDFKWVTIQMDIKINLSGVSDILNYHNQLISAFPKNMMFYSYKYNAYIHVDDFIKDWDTVDDTEGLYYRTTNQKIEGYALYEISPIFRVNSIQKNKNVDGENSINVNIEVRLKVPNVIGNVTIDNRIVNGIQIVGNIVDGSKDLPILIDMNNDIFSDRQNKLKRSYILEEGDFDIDLNQLQVPVSDYQILGLPVSIFMVDDSTINDARVEFIEIPLVTPEMVIDKDIDGTLVPYYVFDLDISLTTFRFSQLSNCQLQLFN